MGHGCREPDDGETIARKEALKPYGGLVYGARSTSGEEGLSYVILDPALSTMSKVRKGWSLLYVSLILC